MMHFFHDGLLIHRRWNHRSFRNAPFELSWIFFRRTLLGLRCSKHVHLEFIAFVTGDDEVLVSIILHVLQIGHTRVLRRKTRKLYCESNEDRIPASRDGTDHLFSTAPPLPPGPAVLLGDGKGHRRRRPGGLRDRRK